MYVALCGTRSERRRTSQLVDMLTWKFHGDDITLSSSTFPALAYSLTLVLLVTLPDVLAVSETSISFFDLFLLARLASSDALFLGFVFVLGAWTTV